MSAKTLKRLERAAMMLDQIRQEFDEFDGDRRGHAAALTEAEEKLCDAAYAHARSKVKKGRVR